MAHISPSAHGFTDESYSDAYAKALDFADPLKYLRDEFVIPTKTDLKRETLAVPPGEPLSEPCLYLCGNSLGLQPKKVREYVDKYLQSWATKAVLGHFTGHSDELVPPYLDVDEAAAKGIAPIVGANVNEVAVMGTLTSNLHLLMASFYTPTQKKHKIILESKAFPSDHFAVESQIRHHKYDPLESMIFLNSASSNSPVLSTAQILETITEHADETALILLPAIQFYTGQYFDVATITAHAHSHGIIIGWDCAHAVGNVDLKLHEWDVDFAVWCHYKYLNSGPGAIGGLFVHQLHGTVSPTAGDEPSSYSYRPRLSGWWGSNKKTRFCMDNRFSPTPGAAGWQVSNPSVLDTTALLASLAVFAQTDMAAIRRKSILLTDYMHYLLINSPPSRELSRQLAAQVEVAGATHSQSKPFGRAPAPPPPSQPFSLPKLPYTIITPPTAAERGAQLSLLFLPHMMDPVFEQLERDGVVVDERRPDVIRVAPCPLYNSFTDVFRFVELLCKACSETLKKGVLDGKLRM